MNHTPKFSVIIPAYNAAGHIRNGLNSIISQSYDDYELIVVCDSCYDSTESIAREYGAKTIPVNYGRDGLTRNAGLDAARGEWILFMDDDDWFLHEYVFQLLADNVGKNDEDVFMFSYIWHNKKYVQQTPDNITVHVWSKCWRRESIGDTRFSFIPNWSDTTFHKKMMRKIRRAAFWNMPLYYYNYMREGSITEQFFNKKIR